jgi:hypothetical protein
MGFGGIQAENMRIDFGERQLTLWFETSGAKREYCPETANT